MKKDAKVTYLAVKRKEPFKRNAIQNKADYYQTLTRITELQNLIAIEEEQIHQYLECHLQ